MISEQHWRVQELTGDETLRQISNKAERVVCHWLNAVSDVDRDEVSLRRSVP